MKPVADDALSDALGWVRATLGLGGNVGDPVRAMAEALKRIDGHAACRVVIVSRLYSTPPWGRTDQPDFVNACALIETRLSPQDLLELCLSIERELKRVRLERWGPRTIDIDILTYADRDVSTDTLAIPHPRITERAFVLVPLADIAPDLMIAGNSVEHWANVIDHAGIAAKSDDGTWWRKGN